jgi:hypothetical protein
LNSSAFNVAIIIARSSNRNASATLDVACRIIVIGLSSVALSSAMIISIARQLDRAWIVGTPGGRDYGVSAAAAALDDKVPDARRWPRQCVLAALAALREIEIFAQRKKRIRL